MFVTKTFDEVFDHLYNMYKGKWVEIKVKREGLLLSNFSILIEDLKICPLNNNQLKREMGLNRKDKLGSMVITGKNSTGGKANGCLNIPFKLGFNTVNAHFNKGDAIIESFGFQFIIRKI